MNSSSTLDVIAFERVGTLGGLLRERARRTPDSIAYRYFDQLDKEWKDISWQQTANRVAQIQAAHSRRHPALRRGCRRRGLGQGSLPRTGEADQQDLRPCPAVMHDA